MRCRVGERRSTSRGSEGSGGPLAGCGKCNAEDPEAAYAALSDSPRIDALISRAHFDIELLRCESCGQPWVYVYAEFVNFAGDEDPDYRDYVPISEEELRELTSLEDRSYDAITTRVKSLAEGRTRLQADWPVGADGLRPRWTTEALVIAPWT